MRQRYLLDTNAVIAILNDRPPSVRKKLRTALKRGEVLVSSIVFVELWYGVAKSSCTKENAERLRVFMAGDMTPIPFDEDDAKAAGEVRAALEIAGKTIGAYDLLIAGQALRLGATLVTANQGELGDVPGLKWENWAHA